MNNYSTLIESYKNKKINNWIVIEFSHRNERHDPYWKCLCTCGRIQNVRARQVVIGISRGCRYCRKQSQIGIKSPNWKGGKFISSELWNRFRFNAVKRNIPFNVSIQDIENVYIKQEGKCAYTKEVLTFGERTRDKGNTSIDRIDSKNGYTINNIQLVLKKINIMKNTLEHNDFIKLCLLVAEGSCGT